MFDLLKKRQKKKFSQTPKHHLDELKIQEILANPLKKFIFQLTQNQQQKFGQKHSITNSIFSKQEYWNITETFDFSTCINMNQRSKILSRAEILKCHLLIKNFRINKTWNNKLKEDWQSRCSLLKNPLHCFTNFTSKNVSLTICVSIRNGDAIWNKEQYMLQIISRDDSWEECLKAGQK